MAEFLSLDQIKPVNAPPPAAEGDSKFMTPDQIKPAQPAAKGADGAHVKALAGGSMESDVENQQLAAAQGTTPNVDAHKKRYLGDATFSDEDYSDPNGPSKGSGIFHKKSVVMYKDDKGMAHPTDENKHVVLRDPTDSKYKVYERHKETDEGKLASVGRMIMSGMAGGPLPVAGPANTAGKTMSAVNALKDATGVEVTVPRTATTDSAIRQGVTRAVGVIPGASAPFEKASAQMEGGLHSAAEAAAELPTGVKATAESAGEAARSGIITYTAPESKGGVLATNVSKAYDKVDSLMGSAPLKDLKETRAAAQELQSEWEGMKKAGMPESVKEVLGAVTDPKGLDYKSLKRLRSTVGEDVGAAEGSAKAAMKRLYRGLSEDMEKMIADHAGPRGSQLWGRAKDYARLAADRTEKLQNLLGTRSDEGIFGRIATMAGETTTANAKLLSTVKKSLHPDEWNEVVSGVVGRLGRTKVGDAESFNPSKFLKDYGKISDRGKDLLFGTEGDLRKSLDSISQISERWPQQKVIAHPSGEVSHIIGTLGAFHSPWETMKALLGGNTMAKILSRPTTARYAARWFQKSEQLRLNPTPATVTAANNASRLMMGETAKEFREEAGWAAEKAAGLALKYNPYTVAKRAVGL